MRYFLIILISLGLCYGAYEGYQLRKLTIEQTEYKEALAEMNRINYGLFNMELWKDKALSVFMNRIDNFNLNPQVYKEIDRELNVYLGKLYVEWISSGALANLLIDEGERQGKIPKLMGVMLKKNISDIVRGLNLNREIPAYANVLTAEIKKNEPMLAGYLQEALKGMLFDATVQTLTDARIPIYKKYDHATLLDTNTDLKERVSTLESKINSKIKVVYSVVLGLVILCLFLYGFIGAISAISLISFGSIVLLLLGVSMPMIDIDARLNNFTMDIIGTQLSFDEQYLYYQSKSILDVTWTLIEGRGIDLKIVGIMILLFSIVVPFIKLVLSSAFLYSNKIRNSKLAKGIIYHLGKWSMADVFVVAMFMAYIGFYGIITSQLGEIGRNQTGYAVETLNYSKLSPGALFFTTYCILSIITGILIKRWEGKQEME
ncbi:MAG: hypothetical protein ACJA1A_000863 [Saprospiraceae bacterium]|mgnify:CR=1 FL=1|jgi:hypothetical protein